MALIYWIIFPIGTLLSIVLLSLLTEKRRKLRIKKIILDTLEQDTSVTGTGLHQRLADAGIFLSNDEFCAMMHLCILDRLVVGEGAHGSRCCYSLRKQPEQSTVPTH